MAQINAKLSDGRTRAKTTFEELSKQGMDIQKQALTAAQSEAAVLNKNAKDELGSAVEKARGSLRSDIEAFSRQIVEKLVKA